MNPQVTNIRLPSSSNYLIINYNKNLKKSFIKSKIKGLKNVTGRSNNGKIISYHKGGGHKKNYRNINFNNYKHSIGIVITIEYDPNRTAYIAAIYEFISKKYMYVLAPKNLQIGDILKSGTNAELKLGHSLPLKKLPIGSFVYNIAFRIQEKGKIARSAGTFARLVEKNSHFGLIKMNSGEYKSLPIHCCASIGVISNEFHYLKKVQKAGKSRWLNKRPTVRGVAMNPIDHPHGGGEGKKSGLKLSPWGKFTSKKIKKPKKNG
jgi:large subunit ribosomal protein L2